MTMSFSTLHIQSIFIISCSISISIVHFISVAPFIKDVQLNDRMRKKKQGQRIKNDKLYICILLSKSV